MSRILLISINKYCYWLSSLICFATFQKVIERQYMKYVCIYIYIYNIYIYKIYIYHTYIIYLTLNKKMKLEQLHKVGSECELKSRPDSSVVSRLQRLNRIQWLWVQIPLRLTFYSYFKESCSGEYHMYQVIPLDSCDSLYKISIKIKVVTDRGNCRHKI